MAKLTVRGGANYVEIDITGKNLLKTLINLYPDGIGDAVLLVNKQKVDLKEFDIDRSFDCDIELISNPKGIDPITAAIIAVVAIAASLAASYLLAPDIPSGSTGSKKSPNDDFSGQTNQIRLNEIEPNIYGNVIAYPDIITNEGGYWEYIDNRKIVRETFLLGSGEYQINSEPKYEQTPLSSIDGSTYAIYGPSDIIPTVYGQFNAEIVDGQGLPGPNNDDVTDGIVYTGSAADGATYDAIDNNVDFESVTATQDIIDLYDKYGNTQFIASRSYTYYEFFVSGGGGQSCDPIAVNDTGGVVISFDGVNYDVSFINVSTSSDPCDPAVAPAQPDPDQHYSSNLSFTEKLGSTVKVNQPILTEEIQLSFEFRRGLKGTCTLAVSIADSLSVQPTIFETYTYSANTTSPKYFSEKIAHTFTDEVIVTVYRINNDKDDGSDSCQLTQVASNSYRNNVTVGDKTILTTDRKATEQAVKAVRSKINVDITRKTVSWSEIGGLNTTLTASRSFADAMLHEYYSMNQLTDIDQLPLEDMYEISDRIGAIGYFDGTFSDKEQSLKEKLNIIANVARCSVSFSGQGYDIVRDEARLPVAQFDSRNIDSESSEEVSFKGATTRSNDGVRVEYRNPDTNKKEYLYFAISGETVSECIWNGSAYVPAQPLTPLEVDLVGCFQESQARDRGILEAKKIIYIQKTLKITTLKDGENVLRGEVVKHADYYEQDIASGEIKQSVGDLHESYSTLNIPVGSYYVTYTDEYGMIHGPIACTVISETIFQATLPDSYIADGYLIQCGSRFVISTIEEHETNLYEVASKQANSDGTVELELLQYSDSVYS